MEMQIALKLYRNQIEQSEILFVVNMKYNLTKYSDHNILI